MAILRSLPLALLVSISIFLGGCKEDAPPAVPKGPEAWFPIKIGSVELKVQVMVRSMELQQGLMHRAMLGDDEGMVFVYPDEGGRSFWMRNTLIPLDIGFFSPSGELSEVRQMNPLDETPITSYSSEIQFAIETNQGWYHENGVKPGAKLDMKALEAAIVARGFDLKALGLK